MSTSTRIIRNGIAATLRQEGYRQSAANTNARQRASMLLDEARLETEAEFDKRVALDKKVSEQEELLVYWVSASKAYRETIKFLRENWTPPQATSEGPVSAQAKEEMVNKKIGEEHNKILAATPTDIRASVADEEAGVLRYSAEARKRYRRP